jgi:phage repressor protein C with HTH and peptisase S24 domain
MVARGDVAVRSTALARIRPAEHAADIDADNFGDGRGATTLLDNSARRVHVAKDCGIRNFTSRETCALRNMIPLRKAQTIPMDAAWISSQLAADPAKTQRGLAAALGLDPAAVNRMLIGKRQIKVSEVPVIEAYFGASKTPSIAEQMHSGLNWGNPSDKIPVKGTTEGGNDGHVEWNGETIDRVERPPFLAGAKDAYALYVRGESMSPRYEAGELVYVHPGRPVTAGSYCVVQVRVEGSATPGALVKQFVKRSATLLTLRQFNPAKVIEIADKRVISIHRIVGSTGA